MKTKKIICAISIIILFVCIKPLNAQVCFTSTNYLVGNGTTTIACADFNSDGKLDLIVAHNGASQNILLLLGNGNGSFGVATPISSQDSLAPDPRCLISGDFNGDGKPDLAAAQYADSSVVLLGDGNGNFPTRKSFVAGNYPLSICSSDFNGDGLIDLATANDGSISVLLGNGTGNFLTHVDFLAEHNLNAITSGDFNGDGKIDLAATANNNGGGPDSVWVFIGNGSGSFGTGTKYLAGSGPYSVCSKDFNGDGFSDIAVANTNSNDASVLLSQGASGLFYPAINYGTSSVPFSVVSADFNSDGIPDLALGNDGQDVSILLGIGSGSFGTASKFSAYSFPWTIITADFNGDGKPDLASADHDSPDVSVLLDVVVLNCIGCALNAAPPTPTICMVTTDSASNYNYNVVEWDKTQYTNVDSFIVYRKDAISSNYLRIGAVSMDSLSEFIDTAFSIGGPNGGNPQYSSWLYKLAIVDSCGNISAKSPYHQSMFVQKTGANFSWNAYTVETGQTNPVTGYSFLRDDNNTGNWHVLVNTVGLSTTDPNYTSYPNGNWRIDALGFNCNPTTMRLDNTQSIYLKSHSNTTQPAPMGINQLTLNDEQISVFPNPTNGKFKIIIGNPELGSASALFLKQVQENITIYNVFGEKVYSMSSVPSLSSNEIDLSAQPKGIYFIEIICGGQRQSRKIVLQ